MKFADKLKNKAYRSASVESSVTMGLSFQLREIRRRRGISQAKLAKMAGMKQSRISSIETYERPCNLHTLLRIAKALDVALWVRFVSFEEFRQLREDRTSPDGMYAAPYREKP